MIAVIFEVKPAEGCKQEYFNLAAELKPILEQVEGFISIERFQSLVDPRKILSLSFFQDDAAVSEWRKTLEHRNIQAKGRASVFDNYRLRVASVIRDYGMYDREEAPVDSQAAHLLGTPSTAYLAT